MSLQASSRLIRSRALSVLCGVGSPFAARRPMVVSGGRRKQRPYTVQQGEGKTEMRLVQIGNHPTPRLGALWQGLQSGTKKAGLRGPRLWNVRII